MSTRPKLTLKELAARAGVTQAELREIFKREALDPTYSIAETAERLGCGIWQVNKLIQFGHRFGADLHPTRGGLYPTIKTSYKGRQIPLSAIRAHEVHMTRVHDGITLEHREVA